MREEICEPLDFSTMSGSALPGKEGQRPMAGSFELSVRHVVELLLPSIAKFERSAERETRKCGKKPYIFALGPKRQSFISDCEAERTEKKRLKQQYNKMPLESSQTDL